MATTYNVNLRNRLTEFDIIIQNLPYREGLIVHTQMCLEVMLNYLHSQTHIAGDSDMELQSKINSMIQRIMVAWHHYSTLTSEAKISSEKFVKAESDAILSMNNPSLFYLLEVQCETCFSLLCSADSELLLSLGHSDSSFCLSTYIDGASTEQFLTIDSSIQLLSEVYNTLICFLRPNNVEASLLINVEAVLQRYRKILEADVLLISDMDSQPIIELDYVKLA